MVGHLRKFTITALVLSAALAHYPSSAADLRFPIVTPGNPAITVGSTIRLTTTGNFSDATIRPLSNTTLAVGGNHACVLAANGEIRCWGRGGSGQLGNGGTTDSNVPLAVAGIDTATALAAGGDSSCALLADTSVNCWGLNDTGQLGNGSFTPAAVPATVTGVNAAAISAGFRHACAVLAGGGIRCWGANGFGQLGNGSLAGSPTAVTVSGISTAIAVAAGGNHSCALLTSGAVKCWGDGGAGQLGNGSGTGSSTPVDVAGISDAVAIAAGFDHSCALIAGGTLQCWGRGLEGQLGNNSFANSSTAVNVPVGGGRVVAIATGSSHTCGVFESGAMQCWGRNANGQVGNGTIVGNIAAPANVLAIATAIAVSAGFEHTCAVLGDGNTRCWGLNDTGQLGTGTSGGTNQRSGTPLVVSGPVLGVDAGGNHTCAITPTGTVNCWGQGVFGQLGNDGTSNSAVPVTVVRLDNTGGSAAENAVSLGIGFEHSCAALQSGRAKCWGRDQSAQIGNGVLPPNPPQYTLPEDVWQMSTAAKVASGATHSCVVLTDGTVQCWGSNSFGAIGLPDPVNSTFPRTITGITNATRVSVGLNHSCALLATGLVQCWGRGDEGQLGNGGTANSSSPVTVTGISNATFIGLGNAHSCARLVGGTARCWGRNVEGQLGNSSTVSSTVPVVVTGLSTATSVDGGGFHTCATLSTGGVNCWGRGDKGQLGNGFFLNISGPVVVGGVAGAVAVTAGGLHSCAVLVNGRLRCWGDNEFGQLGNGVSGTGAVSASALAVNGINMDAPALAWTSDNPSVATVDMSGHVHAVALGVARLNPLYDSRRSFVNVTVAVDTDGDGIADPADNCSIDPNPTQLDADGDGYGNICDADLNNSGLVTTGDFAILRSVLNQAAGSSPTAAAADLNGSGTVTTADFAILRDRLNTAPGPSGYHP